MVHSLIFFVHHHPDHVTARRPLACRDVFIVTPANCSAPTLSHTLDQYQYDFNFRSDTPHHSILLLEQFVS